MLQKNWMLHDWGKGRPIWFLGGVRVFLEKKQNFEFYKKKQKNSGM